MNTTIRRSDRAITDINEIYAIIEKADVLRLGLSDGEYPYIVPMHYGFEYDKKKDRFLFYLHSAKEGHKLDLIRQNSNVCIELDTDVELVSGDTACQYGARYASVIGRGKAQIIEERQEKQHGLKLLMENQTGKKFEITGQMADAVAVIKVEMDCYTAKGRR